MFEINIEFGNQTPIVQWAFPEKIRTPYVEDIKSKQKFMTPWNFQKSFVTLWNFPIFSLSPIGNKGFTAHSIRDP